MSQEARVRVAIIGAGIAGLTLAVALNAFDKERKIAIDIYENAPELSEIGAGINMWPRIYHILKEIGLADTLIPLFDHYPDLEPRIVFEVRKADQRNGFKIIDVMKDGGALRIHRADFQRSLIKHLPLPGSNIPINSTCALHLSHRLIDYTLASSTSSSQSDPITLYFADDQPSRTCDILIGADGIKSTMRKLFFSRLPNPEKYQSLLDPVWSGVIVYRGLVEKEELKKVFPGHRALTLPGVMYIGKDKHTVAYPISGGNFVNVVAATHDKSKEGTVWEGPWSTDTTQEEFSNCFAGWEDEYQALIQCIRRPTKWALQNLNHLDVYAEGRVMLIGDAVHAMVPHQGAGAGVGIEDAYIIAALLTHPSSIATTLSSQTRSKPFTKHHKLSSLSASRISQVYNTIRVPRAIARSKASTRQGYLLVLHTPEFKQFKKGDDTIPKDLLVKLFREVEGNWSWTTSDPAEDKREAIDLLVSTIDRPRL